MERTVATLILCLVISGLASAQGVTTGRITGRVVDESGNPVAEARLALISPALQGERVTVADSAGRFLAALLPVGPYAVSASAPRMQTVTVSLRVTVGGTESLQLTLLPGEKLEEAVTVYGTTTPLETTAVGETFNYDKQVEELPIIDRDLETVAKLAPNVTNTFNEQGGASRYLSISGGTYLENATQLDGAELTDQQAFVTRELYLEDAVEELQVLTAGVSARYGRFSGGVLNAITKSGGNTFDGTVRAEFSKESWNSQTPLGEEQSDTLDQVYQATLGGYILKDKLWFFAGARTIPSETISGLTFATNEPYTETRTEDRWQIKLRGAPAPNHTIELSYLDSEFAVAGGSGGQGGLPGDLRAASAMGSSGVFPGNLMTLTYQGIVGGATFVEAMAAVRNVASERGGSADLGSPIWDGSESTVFYNSFWSDPGDSVARDNESIGVNVSHVISTATTGAHTLEGGAQYVNSISGGANAWSSTGYIWGHFDNQAPFPFVEGGAGPGGVVFNVNSTDQENIRWEDIPLDGNQEVENLALYAQDSWSLRKWRIDFGLRWENYRATAPAGGDLGIDANELAPRLGVTFNIRSNLQVQAFWGRYVSRLDDLFLTRNTGIAFNPSIGRLYAGPEVTSATVEEMDALLRDDANWGELVELLDPENPTSFIAEDLSLPYADDLNLSVRYGLPRSSGSITVNVIDRDYRDLLEPQVGDFGTVDVPAPDGPEVLTVDRIALGNFAAAERTYRALATTWDYRPGAQWDIGGNYTYSETKGNSGEDEEFFSQFGSALGTYERSRPEDAATPTGSLSWDKTHLFRLWGNYRFDLKRAGVLALGGIVRYESGTPWSRRARVSFSDDPIYVNETENRYWHYFDGRGNNNFDDWWSLDLSGRYQVTLGKGVSVWIKATVANVLNNDAQIAFNTSGSATDTPPADCPDCVEDVGNGLTWIPNATFGEARSTDDFQAPRRFLFTLGIAF